MCSQPVEDEKIQDYEGPHGASKEKYKARKTDGTNLVSNKTVEKRRFSNIWMSYNKHQTGLKGLISRSNNHDHLPKGAAYAPTLVD